MFDQVGQEPGQSTNRRTAIVFDVIWLCIFVAGVAAVIYRRGLSRPIDLTFWSLGAALSLVWVGIEAKSPPEGSRSYRWRNFLLLLLMGGLNAYHGWR